MGAMWRLRGPWCRSSEPDLVRALEREDLARFVRRCDLEAQTLDDLAHVRHLFGIRFGKSARTHPERILKSYTHVAAHRRRHGRDRHLVASSAQHGPAVFVAEQSVAGALHVHYVLRVR